MTNQKTKKYKPEQVLLWLQSGLAILAGSFLIQCSSDNGQVNHTKSRSLDSGPSAESKNPDKSVDVGNPVSNGPGKNTQGTSYSNVLPEATVPLKFNFQILDQSAENPVAIKMKSSTFYIKRGAEIIATNFVYTDEPMFGFGNQTEFQPESIHSSPLKSGDELAKVELDLDYSGFQSSSDPNKGTSLNFSSKTVTFKPLQGEFFSVGPKFRIAFTLSHEEVTPGLPSPTILLDKLGTFEVSKH